MVSKERRPVHLALCLGVTAAVTFAAPPPLRIGRVEDETARPAQAAQSPPSALEESLSADDALRDFVKRLPAPDALAREDGGRSSVALAYAPADGGLDAAASHEPKLPPPPEPAALLGDDAAPFAHALALYKAGDFSGGEQAAAAIADAVARAAAQWAGLRLHPREAGFSRLSRFVAAHPNWPGDEWLRQRAEEALFGDKHSAKTVKAHFQETKPRTAAGRLALARLRLQEGEPLEAAALVKEAWRENDLGETLESAIRKEFADFLDAADHKYRADRLLYAEKARAALRAAELAGKEAMQIARARITAANDSATEATFSNLPPSLRSDPGVLLAHIHMLRHKEKITEAAALMRSAPRDPRLLVDGDAWWTERRLIARKLLDKGDAPQAYLLCAQHSARSTAAKVEAEFHAGWIALRFLNDPAKAKRHFDLLAQAAETPIQKSRAAYWQGRAAEQSATPDEQGAAPAFFEQAAKQSTTYYGQLARTKVGDSGSPLRAPPTPAEGAAREEAVRSVELYFAVGERELAAQLAAEAARRLESPEQLAALAGVTARQRDARVSLALGRLASYRGVALDDAAFPAFGVPQFSALPGSAARAVVYAIARQESAFDSRAVSSAGAMGLMQMIASTARRTAQQTGVGFALKRLIDEPAFNAQLGAAHLGMLLGEHKGSYVLAFAAYNAGGKRVKEWIDAYGDPRRKEIDPIDWVERIPISETRNYIQRVIENLVVYRAKFSDREIKAPQMELARAKGP